MECPIAQVEQLKYNLYRTKYNYYRQRARIWQKSHL